MTMADAGMLGRGHTGSKEALRDALVSRRGSVSGGEVNRVGARVSDFLKGLLTTGKTETVVGYVPIGNEVDVSSFLQWCGACGHDLLLPRFNAQRQGYELASITDFERDTALGWYGIPEPVPGIPAVSEARAKGSAVTWLVPALAFDRIGNRLGRGKGFYDRLLEGAVGLKIGVAYSWQVLTEALPIQEYDVPVDVVVSEEGVIGCNLDYTV